LLAHVDDAAAVYCFDGFSPDAFLASSSFLRQAPAWSFLFQASYKCTIRSTASVRYARAWAGMVGVQEFTLVLFHVIVMVMFAGEAGPEGLEELLREQAEYDPKRRAWARIEAALATHQLPDDADIRLMTGE